MRVASFLYRRSDLEPTLVPPRPEPMSGVHALGGDCYSITRPGPLFVRPRLSRSLLTFRLGASRYRPGLKVLSSPPVEEGRFVASSLRL
jgi:hypothetical protein